MPYPSYFARKEVSSKDKSFVDFSKTCKDYPHLCPYMGLSWSSSQTSHMVASKRERQDLREHICICCLYSVEKREHMSHFIQFHNTTEGWKIVQWNPMFFFFFPFGSKKQRKKKRKRHIKIPIFLFFPLKNFLSLLWHDWWWELNRSQFDSWHYNLLKVYWIFFIFSCSSKLGLIIAKP